MEPKKIVLAFDSFKGSASSKEVADAAEVAIHRVLPECNVVKFEIADGGEGTTKAICSVIESEEVVCHVHDPLSRVIEARYNITANGTAIMEMATASGLTLVPEKSRNPIVATSSGTGEMISDAINRGCKTIVLGIGGSATNDAGIGLLSALGIKFLDKNGNRTLRLCDVESFDETGMDERLADTRFIVACDVTNPFYGTNGAAHVFAPQKGADKEQVEVLDNGLRKFAQMVKAEKDIDLQAIPGSGAAGGMGGGLVAFLNATLQPGIDTILDIVGFNSEICDCNLILTGEGSIDMQSAMGKTIGGIVRYAQRLSVPVIAIGGNISAKLNPKEIGLLAAFSIQQGPISLEEAMTKENTLRNVGKTIEQIIRLTTKFQSQITAQPIK